jgi:hypothetical protein
VADGAAVPVTVALAEDEALAENEAKRLFAEEDGNGHQRTGPRS